MDGWEKKSDEELVKLSLEDSENYYFVMKRYESKLLRYILRIASVARETAEDILQEVFIKVYKNLNDFDDSYSFSSWIYRITHNETISQIRKIKARPQTVKTENGEMFDFLNILPDDTNLVQDYEKKELAEKVRGVINQLPEKYRNILILRYLEDKEYLEISDIIKKPIGTVSTLINRAKKNFRKMLTKNNLKFTYND